MSKFLKLIGFRPLLFLLALVQYNIGGFPSSLPSSLPSLYLQLLSFSFYCVIHVPLLLYKELNRSPYHLRSYQILLCKLRQTISCKLRYEKSSFHVTYQVRISDTLKRGVVTSTL